VANRTPKSIEIIEEGDRRFAVMTYADGTIIRKLIDPNERPKRKPRKPIARARPIVRPKGHREDDFDTDVVGKAK
jgi:hypothetical protein